MLDPDGRRDVLSIIKRLHDEKGKTIIMITHYIEESIIADRIILMNKGRITAQGPPRVDIFPFTGVTLPFISNGGTSMISSWGLLVFLKAADMR